VRRLLSRVADPSLAHGLLPRLYGRIRGQVYLDRAGPRSTFFLAGSPRSGTTWVAERVAASGLRLIFEPFHPDEVASSRDFDHRRYVRPSSTDEPLLRQAKRVVQGRIRSSWTDRYNRRVLPDRRLIKEVRANLYLGWLHAQFPWMPIVLVLRHPGAVVASQRAVDWNFSAHPARLLDQEELVEDHLAPFAALLEGARSPVEQGVAVWAAENYVPLAQFSRGEIHVVCYEHLLVRPEEEYRRLLAFYGLPDSRKVLAGIGRPSGVTARGSAVVSGGDVLRAWQDRVEASDRARIVEMLEPFGLAALYGEGPLPLLDDPNELLRERLADSAEQPTTRT
jgi:hypothetical protein